MKRGQKPTREQRKFLALHGIKNDVWLVSKDTPTEIVLVHRESDSTFKVIQKQPRENES